MKSHEIGNLAKSRDKMKIELEILVHFQMFLLVLFNVLTS